MAAVMQMNWENFPRLAGLPQLSRMYPGVLASSLLGEILGSAVTDPRSITQLVNMSYSISNAQYSQLGDFFLRAYPSGLTLKLMSFIF